MIHFSFLFVIILIVNICRVVYLGQINSRKDSICSKQHKATCSWSFVHSHFLWKDLNAVCSDYLIIFRDLLRIFLAAVSCKNILSGGTHFFSYYLLVSKFYQLNVFKLCNTSSKSTAVNVFVNPTNLSSCLSWYCVGVNIFIAVKSIN